MKYLFPLFLLLTGCMVGPKYYEPEMCLPVEFEESPGEMGSDDEACLWWEQFNDPVLNGLIDEALHTNYDLRLAFERIEQSRAQYRIEKSHLWPEIDFNAGAIRTRLSENLLPPPQLPIPVSGSFLPRFLNIFQIGFDAVWEIDFFGRIRHEKNAAYYTWEATNEEAQIVLISLLSEVAMNYINIRALQAQIDIAQKQIQTKEKELELAKQLFKMGLDNEIAVTTLISSLESDRAELFPLETAFKQSIYSLAYLLGRPPEGFIELFEEIRPIPCGFAKVPVGLPSDLLRRRPDIRMAERQLAAATEMVGSAVADLFPRVSLTGLSLGGGNQGTSFGYESFKLDRLLKSASRMFSLGVGLHWNLLDFGRVRATIDVKNSLQRQALLNYEQTVMGSLKEVEGALVAYYEEQLRRYALWEKVEAVQRTYDITENLYNIGLANEMQFLEAYQSLLQAKNILIGSEQALAGDLIALYKAIGGYWNCSYEDAQCL